MTYETIDTSVSGGEPVELYVITAENLTYRYTNSPDPQTAMGELFLPRQIRRTAITYNMSLLDNSNMDFYLPTIDAFAKKCLGLVTPTVLSVQVFQKHVTDPDADVKRAHYGYVMKIESSDEEVRFSTGSLMQAYTSADIGVTVYSYTCNHDLGDEHCKVNLDGNDPDGNPYRVTTTVAGIGGYTLDLASLSPAVVPYYSGGTIVNTRTGQQRPIITIDDTTVYLLAPFVDVLPGDPVKLWPGCDHSMSGPAGCLARFDNVVNFGGFPYIPRKNPFVEGFGELANGGDY